MFKSCQTKFVRVMAVLAIVMVFASMSFAQSTVSGAITGTVTDASGAVVPNAKVEITNTGTNATTSTTSNEAGNFRADNLQPGTYDVKVSAANFSDYKATRLIVEVGRSSNVDAKLAVSGQGETVEVRDEAPVVNTEHQAVSNNFNQDQIQNLPINGRRWSNYALLTPTANPDGNFGLISFRGISGLLNNSTVDGGDNNSNFYGEERGRTRLSYSTSQDSIQEFQVNTSNFSAEYGRSAGGVVNTITKSGSNKLHGSGYWYIRDNALGATNPSSFINGTTPFKADDRRQQFGATLGGPIVKDRAFFFFNYDQQKRNFPGLAVPRSTSTTAGGYAQYTVADPVTRLGAGSACAANNTLLSTYTMGEAIFCRFDGNLALAQAAQSAGFNFFTSLLGTNARRGDQLIFFPKVDLKVLGGNWMTSYNWLNWTSPAGIQTQPTNTIARDAFGDDLVRTRVLNSVFNRALGSRASMEARFHWSLENLSGDFMEALPGQPTVTGADGGVHPPGVTVANWLDFGTRDYLPRPKNPEEEQYQYSGNILFGWGKHTTKIGGEWLHQNEEVQSVSRGYGEFSYSGSFAYADYLADAYNAAANNFTGSGVRRCGTTSDRGCYNNLTQTLGATQYGFTTNDWALFIQDDWKIHPRLNLNMGLRYDRQLWPKAQFVNTLLPITASAPNDNNNLSPRVGFAWDILGTGKLVARGGYGMYYARVINSTIAAGLVNTGVAAAQPSYRITPNATAPIYPNILTSATVPASVGSPDVVFWDPNFETPYIHQSDVVVEWEFMKNTVVSATYMNSMGRGLIQFLDTNLPNAYAGNTTFTRPDGSTFVVPTYGATARPNTSFGRITNITNAADSDYNAIVFQLSRRMTAGWQMQTSYTFSKATDNGQNSATFTTGNNALDPRNPAGEYGRSNFDVPHKFVFSAVWQPMFFKDQKNIAHYLLDDWTLAPIINAYSGFTYTGTIGGTMTGCASGRTGINCSSPGINRPADVEKNTFRSSSRQTVDYRMSRAFRVTEGSKLEFIAEAFNLLNRSNVTGVNSGQFNIGTPCSQTACTLTSTTNFGTPSGGGINNGTNLRERQIQFALRFMF